MREWRAHAVGRGSKDARKVLMEEYKDGLTKEKATELALKALKSGEKKLTLRSVEVGFVENGKFKLMDKNELKEVMKKFI